jgi:hypothetical protein
MSIPLLKTKLHIPRARPELVSRPRLIEQLTAGIHRKLTLVSAPAGFGKTTLVATWVHHLQARRAGAPAPSPPGTSAPPHLGPAASGQETLEYLEQANLFIVPLDDERRWYRYHHLMEGAEEGDDGFGFEDPRLLDTIDRFTSCTDGEFECSAIVGRTFEDIGDHAAFLRDGGCAEIIEALTAA